MPTVLFKAWPRPVPSLPPPSTERRVPHPRLVSGGALVLGPDRTFGKESPPLFFVLWYLLSLSLAGCKAAALAGSPKPTHLRDVSQQSVFVAAERACGGWGRVQCELLCRDPVYGADVCAVAVHQEYLSSPQSAELSPRLRWQ